MSNALRVPTAFFGMVLGLVGLGSCWRAAHRIWEAPSTISEGIMVVAAVVWGLLAVFYVAKWIWARDEAVSEINHPVQCCFVGLFPVSTMLVALAVLPYQHSLGTTLGVLGGAGQFLFSVYRTGDLWTGGRDPLTTTPVLYLPTVGGNFVSAVLSSALGFGDLAALFFGAGFLAWAALESVLIHRLYVHAPLAVPLRPTLGIQLAPAVVGCSAYLSMTHGAPDLIAKGNPGIWAAAGGDTPALAAVDHEAAVRRILLGLHVRSDLDRVRCDDFRRTGSRWNIPVSGRCSFRDRECGRRNYGGRVDLAGRARTHLARGHPRARAVTPAAATHSDQACAQNSSGRGSRTTFGIRDRDPSSATAACSSLRF